MQNQIQGAGATGQTTVAAKILIEPTAGGYRLEFVAEPPEYVCCAICNLPSRDPQLSDCCGHLFCFSCLQERIKSAYEATCPNPKCPTPRLFKTFKNKQVERTVRDLKVFCINKNKGCSWQDKVTDVGYHLSRSCQFQDVECPNQCGESVQRQNYTRHVVNECKNRNVKCQYCRAEGQHYFILDEHKQACPKFPVTCPNGCKIPGLLQEELTPHREKCPLEMIQCEYFNEGCTEKIARQHQLHHNKENVEKHLNLAKNELAKVKLRRKDIQDLPAVKHELGQKVEIIKQEFARKLDTELSNIKKELVAIRNDVAWTQQISPTYRQR